MAVPWWLMPGVMFGTSMYLKSMGTRGKFRWIALPELDVRQMSILVAVTKATSGDALPPPPSGFVWVPIHLTFQPGPLSAPAIVTIHVLQEEPKKAIPAGTAGFLSVEHLQGLAGPRHHGGHHHRGGSTTIYESGPFYPAPLYVEQLPTMVQPTETWTVEWVADGKKHEQVFGSELEARRLKDSLLSSRIVSTVSRGGVL